MAIEVELGVPYTGWPLRFGNDYEFGLDRLSEELILAIEGWAKEFNLLFDDETGWVSVEIQAQHRAAGLRLARRIREELGDGCNVRLVGQSL